MINLLIPQLFSLFVLLLEFGELLGEVGEALSGVLDLL